MRSFWLLIGFLLNFSFPSGFGNVTLLPVLGFSFMLYAVLRMEKLEAAFRRVRYALYASIPLGPKHDQRWQNPFGGHGVLANNVHGGVDNVR